MPWSWHVWNAQRETKAFALAQGPVFQGLPWDPLDAAACQLPVDLGQT